MGTRREKVFYKDKGDGLRASFASVANQSQLLRLPCTHFANVTRLKEWIQSSLQKGLPSFPCTLCDGTRIPWQTLRHLADFTQAELKPMEKILIDNCRNHSYDLKKCPLCARLVQRSSSEVLSVECPQCPEWGGKDYWFCWDCSREWKGSVTHGDICPHSNCGSLVLLQSCMALQRPESAVDGCPSVRQCPACHELLAHQSGCNSIICPACASQFCYRCLQTNAPYHQHCTIKPNPKLP